MASRSTRWHLGRFASVLAALLLVAVVLLTAFAGSASRSNVRAQQFVQEFTVSTGGSCDFDLCVQTTGWEIPVSTPRQATVDLVVSVSFTYQVSAGDFSLATAELILEGETRSIALRPQSYRVASQGAQKTSTTLTWFRKDVPANGSTHRVAFTLLARDGNRDQRVSAFATRGAVVVERF